MQIFTAQCQKTGGYKSDRELHCYCELTPPPKHLLKKFVTFIELLRLYLVFTVSYREWCCCECV